MADNVDSMNKHNAEQYTQGIIKNLRISLIGNDDLKLEVLQDKEKLETILSSFIQRSQILSTNECFGTLEGALEILPFVEDEIIVLNLILSISSGKCFADNTYASQLKSFLLLSESILNLFSMYSKWNFDKSTKGIDPKIFSMLSNIIDAGLDIILSLSNSKYYLQVLTERNSEKLWKFIISVVHLLEKGESISDLPVVKSLNLVKILLSQSSNGALNRGYSNKLLEVCLQCLSSVFQMFYLGTDLATQDPKYFMQYGILSSLLPVFDLNSNEFYKDFNEVLISSLITACAQIYSVKKNDDIIIHNDEFPFEEINMPDVVYYTVLLLVRSQSVEMSLASLNLIFFYLGYRNQMIDLGRSKNVLDKEIFFNNYAKLIPKLIEMVVSNDTFTTNQAISPFLYSPSKILADLGSFYPIVCDEMRKTNFDYCILAALGVQFKTNRKLKKIRLLKQSCVGNSKLADFLIMKEDFNSNEVNSLADLILLLSVYTSTKEEYRARLVSFKGQENTKNASDGLPRVIFELIENYKFLLCQLETSFKILYPKSGKHQFSEDDKTWFSENLSTIVNLLNDPLYTNVLYLTRSLSRSVALLRTFFVECNSIQGISSSEFPNIEAHQGYVKEAKNGMFVNNFVSILRGNENFDMIMKLLQKGQVKSVKHSVKTQILNKSIILCILANFVLDFSSLRYKIVHDNDFLKSLAAIFKNSIANDANCINEEEKYQLNTVQLSVLQILKNYMYNENQENKKDLVDVIPISILFERLFSDSLGNDYTETESVENKKLRSMQKIVCFDILRNLTAGSPYFSRYLNLAYETFRAEHPFLPQWGDFIHQCLTNFTEWGDHYKPQMQLHEDLFYKDNFLLKMLDYSDYVSLVLAVNYIEDHKYTNIRHFRRDMLPSEKILRVWKRFLLLDLDSRSQDMFDLSAKININNNLNCIKLSIVWIIINLTWKNDVIRVSLKDKGNVTAGHVTFDDNIGIDKEEEDIEAVFSDGSDTYFGDDVIDPVLNSKRNSGLPELSTPSDRALMLKSHGLLDALEVLLMRLDSSASSTDINSSYAGKRFDYFMSNDLLEKIKTAQYQIYSLQSDKSYSATQTHLSPIASTRTGLMPMHNVEVSTDIMQDLMSHRTTSIGADRLNENDNTEEIEIEEGNDTESFDEYWIQ